MVEVLLVFLFSLFVLFRFIESMQQFFKIPLDNREVLTIEELRAKVDAIQGVKISECEHCHKCGAKLLLVPQSKAFYRDGTPYITKVCSTHYCKHAHYAENPYDECPICGFVPRGASWV